MLYNLYITTNVTCYTLVSSNYFCIDSLKKQSFAETRSSIKYIVLLCMLYVLILVLLMRNRNCSPFNITSTSLLLHALRVSMISITTVTDKCCAI